MKYIERITVATMVFGIFLGMEVFSQDPDQLTRVEYHLIRTIPNGNGQREIGYSLFNTGEPVGPQAITIDSSGWFYAWDYVNERAVRFDNGNKIELIPEARPFAAFLDVMPDGQLLAHDAHIARSFRIEKGKLRQILEVLPQNYPIGTSAWLYFLSIEDLIIGEYQDSYKLFSIENREDKAPLFRNHDETIRYVRERQSEGRGLWVDEKGFLRYESRLFTNNRVTFVNYWLHHSGRKLNYDEKLVGPVYRGGNLSGVDKDGNYYWDVALSNRGWVYIFNKNGQLLKHLEFFHKEIPRTPITVDTEGNLYFMQHTREGHLLYKIENTWSSKSQIIPTDSYSSIAPKMAVSTESRVRVRSAGTLQADTLGYLEKGDQVEILEQSQEKMQIGEMSDYWYRVRRLSDGLTGWAYGYFLKLE